MRRIFITLAAAVILLSPVILADGSDAGWFYFANETWEGTLEFSMVSPSGVEGFTLFNHTLDPVDLRDYYVTDGEGNVEFNESIVVGSMCSVTIMRSEPEAWMCIDSCHLFGQDGISADRKFTLSDTGDDLYLKKGNETVDSFAWGSVYDSGWQGDGFSKIPKKSLAYMDAYLIGWDIITEWKIYVPGMTLYHDPTTYTGVQVTPFSFPESDGDEIITALQSAQSEVCISIYTISHPRIFSALSYLCGKGVSVRMLVEGSPVGGIPTDEIQYLAALQKKGADIHIIKSADGYKRYQYVHSKYAVIDGCTSVITSENWTESSFASNRGWGCIIEDQRFARILKNMFDSDFDGRRLDISGFRELYPTAISKNIEGFVPSEDHYPSFTADVTPVIAPDYSEKVLYSFLQGAENRIYSQQLYVEYDWTGGGENPLTIMRDAGMRGVDSRVLVDVTYDDPLDTDYKDGYGIYTFFEDDPYLKVKYENSPKFGMAHNKGIVCDDRVWIGSMNWTENSINSNREVSVIIDSKEIADMYASLFTEDWDGSYHDKMILNVNVPDAEYGKELLLDASHSVVPTGCTFEWDLDGDGESERKGRTASWRFYRDTECTLKVTDREGNVETYSFIVKMPEAEQQGTEGNDGGFLDSPLKYLPLILICAIIIVVKRIRSR